MSLDVYLSTQVDTGGKEPYDVQLFTTNITHNLGAMAEWAGVYKAVWRPEENAIKTADQLIPILEAGLKKLIDNFDEASKYNSGNGWGMYPHFVSFLEDYLAACKQHPKAQVRACR